MSFFALKPKTSVLGERALTAVALGIWSVMGAVIVSRHPRHPIGWILCAIPVVGAVDSFAFGYAAYALVAHPGALPGVDILVVWTAISNSSAFFVVLFIILLLLYPDGRFLSPGWRRGTKWTWTGGWRTEISGCGRPVQFWSIRPAQEGSRREFQQWRHAIRAFPAA